MPHHTHHSIDLPSEGEFQKHARSLEVDEVALLGEDDTALLADVDRADAAGNFNVDVLMRAAMCQQLGGVPLALEFWAGQHRGASQGIELGFILGNGLHWWCIRPCGTDLQEWEEVDSLNGSHVASWHSRDALIESLSARCEFVLVLYPVPEEKDAAEDEDGEEPDPNGPRVRRLGKKAELRAARKRAKEERKLARGNSSSHKFAS